MLPWKVSAYFGTKENKKSTVLRESFLQLLI